MLRDWFSDLRYALRGLWKSPVFTGIAVLSLGLGIGANTAIFTLLDQLVLRTLPVTNPEQLVLLTWGENTMHMGNNTGANAISYPMFKDIRERNQVFSDVFCRYSLALSFGYSGQTERVDGELISGNYFQALGVAAAVGRLIEPEDDRVPSGHPVAVLSYDFWVDRFRSDPGIIGKSIVVNGHSLTVIGVSQKGFDGVEVGYAPKIRIPTMMKKEMMPGMWAEIFNLENRRARWVNVFGRLKPGVTREQAKASLQPLFHSILEMEVKEREFAKSTPYVRQQFLKAWIDVLPAARGRSMLRRQFATPLWVLMALVGLVLLIACANVANLLMARATGRQKEFAVRLAMGAHRGHIFRQLITESLLLSFLGAALGLLFASWASGLLVQFFSGDEGAGPLSTSPDLRVLLFTTVVAVLTGIVFGMFPALQSFHIDVAPTLKEQANAVMGGHVRLRKALVVAQVFLSLLLLIAAGLFIRTLQNLKNLDPGLKTENLVAFSINPTLSGYSRDRTFLLYRQLQERLNGIPGVKSTALALVRLLAGDDWENSIAVEGHEAKPGENMNPYFNAVSPGYFSTLGIRLIAGREFLESDPPLPVSEKKKDEKKSEEDTSQNETVHKVAVVNERFAKRFFGSPQRAIGRHFGFGGEPGTKLDIEIVGVIGEVRYNDMRGDPGEQIFIPYVQMDSAFQMTYYVRSALDSAQVASVIRKTVHELDAVMPVYDMRTLDGQLEQSLATERMIAFLASVFGVLATLLAAIGLYGVMVYNVVRRTREIGIRMAIGAASRDVIWMVMREVLVLLALGVALALPAAFALTGLVKSQLYGITPNDPMSLIAATIGIALIAVLAGYIPAMRAAKINPNRALRYE